MSGGIDSAISAAVAVDAIGAERVHCIMMPSPYTSQDSLDDAQECASLLGVQLDEINIKPAMDAFNEMLAPLFEGRDEDVKFRTEDIPGDMKDIAGKCRHNLHIIKWHILMIKILPPLFY